MLCYAMLCYAILCYIILDYTIPLSTNTLYIRTRQCFELVETAERFRVWPICNILYHIHIYIYIYIYISYNI